MLDDLFNSEEIPKEEVYREAQKVIRAYMDKNNKKIEFVAGELGTTKGYLYASIDPNQTAKPLSIDRIIDITRLTGDKRIVEMIAHEVGMLAVEEIETSISLKDINHLVDIANIEGSDVFKTAKIALENDAIDADEKRQILKEIHEAILAFTKLEKSVKNLEIKED